MMNYQNCIYKLTSPSGKVYIGQSGDFKKRVRNYKNPNKCKNQTKLYHALLKYGFENFKVEIIDNYFGDDKEGLNALETYYITSCNTVEDGYNICPVGHSTSGRIISEETRKKLSITSTGRKKTPAQIEHLSKVNTGRTISKSWREKISSSKKSKQVKHSDEYKQKMREICSDVIQATAIDHNGIEQIVIPKWFDKKTKTSEWHALCTKMYYHNRHKYKVQNDPVFLGKLMERREESRSLRKRKHEQSSIL